MTIRSISFWYLITLLQKIHQVLFLNWFPWAHILLFYRVGPRQLKKKEIVNLNTRASKTFALFVLCTKAETGYFGGRQAVKGEESRYSLTEALCLFWVPPWGLHLSPVTNIHIIDRVLYCRMQFLSPIIENWLWKWYRGIEKNTFQTNFIFFFQAFSTYFVHLFYNIYEMYESIYVEIMIMPRVRRRPILFWKK